MLRRPSREMVSIVDHLASEFRDRLSAAGFRARTAPAGRARNQYCTACANVPTLFWWWRGCLGMRVGRRADWERFWCRGSGVGVLGWVQCDGDGLGDRGLD